MSFFPIGNIPPLLIDNESSGINFFRFISCSVPSPLHVSHIPFGELKEKVLGSGLGYEIPVSGHIKFLLKYSGFPDSESKIKIVSFPYFMAILIDSANTLFDSKSSLTDKLSTTRLISCVLYLSSFIPLLISTISPSTITFENPCLVKFSKRSL